MPAIVRETGLRSAVAVPVFVERELWGAMAVASIDRSLPPDTRTRLADFTELVATAVANTQAREQVRTLVDEQAALRRVATLVARGVGPNQLFSAVSNEVGRLFGSDQASVTRFDHEVPATVIVGVSDAIDDIVRVGTRWELHDSMASAHVFRTARSARVDRTDGHSAGSPAEDTIERLDLQSTVASPIVVEGSLWGTITVSSSGQPLPADTERRLEKFTELVATAIANAESREARAVLTEEQAALRRVAILVAQDAAPTEIFAAVSAEVDRVFGLDPATFDVAVVGRFEPGPELVDCRYLEERRRRPARITLAARRTLRTDPRFRTGRSARIRADDVGVGRRRSRRAPPKSWLPVAGRQSDRRRRPSLGSNVGHHEARTFRPTQRSGSTRFTELVGDRDRKRRVTRGAGRARRRAGGAAARRDAGGTRGIASRSLRGRRRGGRPPVTRRKRHDGALRTGRQRDHGGLVEHHRGCLSYRQAVADRGHERRVDGAPDGPVRSYRRLLSCHRPDRRRRAGGGHQVGGWKPDRRRRPISGAS